MTYSTPLYGIPVPDGTSLAKNLPAELKAMGEGFEAALNAHVAVPVSNAAVVTATSASARDSYWGNPSTETARLTLQARGATTIRTDKNITERFFATYDATTNPQGMTPAGWYPIGSPSSLIPTTRSATERDAIFGNPTTSQTQLELQNRGARTFRSDLGVTEQYFATYNATTNVSGRDVPGWYSTTKQTGLIPIKPSSVTISSGTASTNAIGQVTFSGAGTVMLNGIFSGAYKHYKIKIEAQSSVGNTMFARMCTAGVSNTTNNYMYQQFTWQTNTSGGNFSGADNWFFLGYLPTVRHQKDIEISNPFQSQQMAANYQAGYGQTVNVGVWNFNGATSFDGLQIFCGSGTISGTITVYGYME